MEAKYELKNGNILKDGHTMFPEDVVMDLNRKSYLEGKLSQPLVKDAKKQGNCLKCGNKLALCTGTFLGEADDEPYQSGESIELDIDVNESANCHYCETCNEIQSIWTDYTWEISIATPEPRELPTFQDIEKEFPTKGMNIFNAFRRSNTYKQTGAQWVRSQHPRLVTDKEIEERYPTTNTDPKKEHLKIINTAKQEGARWLNKWMRNLSPQQSEGGEIINK